MAISRIHLNNSFLKRLVLLGAIWLVSSGGTRLVLRSLGIAEQAYSNLIINGVFLLTSIGTICLFGLSAEDVGLKIIPERLTLHIRLSLALYAVYWLHYLFVLKISGFRPFDSATAWGLLNYLVVSVVEEIYFRGIWYHIGEKRFSGRAAVLISGLLFGLVHFRQGLGMLPRFFTGWLWGSLRYVTGMIFLLVPIHFTYNAVWLLFQGNWNNPPKWSCLLPLVEFLMAILILARLKNAENQIRIGTSSGVYE